MTNKNYVDWYLQRFAEYEKSLNGQSSSSLHQLRKSAIEQFARLGFPSTKDEEWKYTSLAELSQYRFDPLIKPADLKNRMPSLFPDANMITLIFVNGRFLAPAANLETPLAETGIHLFSTMKEDALFSLLSPEEGVFPALNTAFFKDGIYINVPKSRTVDRPIHIINITEPGGQLALNQPRLVVQVAEQARLDIIETFIGFDGENYFSNPLSSFTIGANAQVGHYRIQAEGDMAHHISTTRVHLAQSADFNAHAVFLGGRMNRNDMFVTLAGENGRCTLNGLYVANQQQHIDNRTHIAHQQAYCQSTQVYKGILDNQARGIFNGKIHVYPDAQKTNAIQSSNALLLSDDSTINTKPQLEIYADDVRCTHGATVGQLDKEAFFYLRSRGIGQEKAQNMLVFAFAADVLGKMQLEPVKRWVTDRFVEKLNALKPEEVAFDK